MRGRTNLHRKNKLYRCFCCFHVRSGALALGTWHLMVHLFAISLLAYMSANIDEINSSVQSLTIYIRRAQPDTSVAIDKDSSSLTTNTNGSLLLSNPNSDNAYDEPIALPVSMAGGQSVQRSVVDSVDPSEGVKGKKVSWYWSSYVYTYAGLNSQPQLSQHDLNAAFIVGCLIVAIALLMMVGIVKGKPAYIFPFLGYQLGDLFVSSLTVAGVICLGPNIKQFLLSGEGFPYREEVQQMDNQWFIMSLALAILAVVLIKAYFVQVVWLCIRYMREEKLRKLREECQPKVIFLDANTPSSEAESTLYIFDNEGEVIKKSPPPAYERCGEETAAPPAYTA